MRRVCKTVKIGNISIGGNSPIAIQSMLSIPSYNIEGSIAQAKALEAAGCKITIADIDKPKKLFLDCVKYSPYPFSVI